MLKSRYVLKYCLIKEKFHESIGVAGSYMYNFLQLT